MKKPERHVWVIDGIEEDVARVEEDGKRVVTVPRALLPASAREGQVLSVECDASHPGRSITSITVDEAATTRALEGSRARTASIASASRTRDPGGDVVL